MRRNIDGTYVNDDRPVLFTVGLLILAFTFGTALWHRLPSHGFEIGTIGLALGIGVSVVAALAIPSTRFIFDPNRKLITWRRRSFFGTDGGQLNFADVRSVKIETTVSERGVAYRVALDAANGALPLSITYTPDRAQNEKLATSISGMLNIPLTQPA